MQRLLDLQSSIAEKGETDELISEKGVEDKTLSLADIEQLSYVPSTGNEESKQEFMLLIDKMHRGSSSRKTPGPARPTVGGGDSSMRLSKRSYSSVITVNNSVNALEAASNAAT